MTKLVKGAFFTDIHFGKKANSEDHNKDCIRFIEWFIEKVQAHNCDYVGFLGDWYENRTAINVLTSQYSHQGSKMLESLDIPIYFIVGNHDLYYKSSRDVHSLIHHGEFDNFTLIEQPTVIEDIRGKALFCPYIFHDEYPELGKYLKIPFWCGHFEFEGFIVTGYNIKMKDAPKATMFKGPRDIVSGHFHKRQSGGNVTYIGSPFPMDFSDAGDTDRGMMIYDHMKHKKEFINWESCPKYIKVSLKSLMNGEAPDAIQEENTRVKCIVDEKIEYDTSKDLREGMLKEYGLREFTYEESPEFSTEIDDVEFDIDWENEDIENVDELVVRMLQEVDSEKYDKKLLTKIYQELKIEE